jgi:T5SS/PEP-CTERM-associated repeat protein
MKTPRILTTTIATFLLAVPSFAVTDTWDGGGANDNLNTALNWLDNTAPASDLVNTDLIFAGLVRLTPNVSAVFSTNSVTFNNTAGAFVFSGSTLTVGAGGIVNNDTQTQTFDNAISVSAASSSFNAASGGLTFTNNVNIGTNTLALDGAGAFSFGLFFGGGTVNKNGAGTMTWSPDLAQTLDLAINAGTVNTDADATTDVFSAAASIAVNGTSTFNINESLTLDGAQLTRATGGVLTLAAGKTLTVQNGGDVTITGAFTHNAAANVVVTGAGSTFTTTLTMTLASGSTMTVQSGGDVSAGAGGVSIGTSGNGTVTVDGSGSSLNGGTLTVGLSGATGSLTFSNGSTGAFGFINVDSSGTVGTSGTLSIQSGATVTGSGSLTIAPGAVANSGTVTIDGAGSALTISGTGTTTIGATSASDGDFIVQNGGTFSSATGTITVGATGAVIIVGGTFNANGNMTLNGVMTRDATGVFNLAAGRTLTVQGGGAAGITGTQNFTGANLTVTGADSQIAASSNMNINSGATIQVSAGGRLTATNLLNLGNSGPGMHTVTVDGASSQLSSGNGGAWGQFGGVTNVTFSNDAVGSFGGTLQLGNHSSSGSTGTVLVQSGADVTTSQLLVGNTAAASTTGSVTVTGAGSTWTISGGNFLGVGATGGSTGTLTVASGGVFNSGTGSSVINTTGTLALNGGTFVANGGLNVNGGQFTRDAAGTFTLPAGRVLTVQAGGDAIITGNLALLNNVTVNVSGPGSSFALNAGELTTDGGALNVTGGASVSLNNFNFGSSAAAWNASVVGGSSFNVTGSNANLGSGSIVFSTNATGALPNVNIDPAPFAINGVTSALTVQSDADVTAFSTDLGIGDRSNTCSLTVTGAGSTYTETGVAITRIGSTALTTPCLGTLTVANGGVYTSSGIGSVSLNPTGTINVSGGTATFLGPLVRNGGVVNFTAGALNIIDAFTVGVGGLLGENLTLDATQRFSTTGTSTIDAFQTLTLNGGTFSTGALVNNGAIAFDSGTLAITGAGGFEIGAGALGANVVLGVGANLQVTNTLTVAGTGILSVDGGSVSAGALSNSGLFEHIRGALTITGTAANITGADFFAAKPLSIGGVFTNQSGARLTLQNGTGRVNGAGSITNAGLITGDGVFAVGVTNISTGEIRAESGRTLYFTGTVAANQGDFILQGGTLDFTNAITNNATGFISGHGALHTGGLTNNGQMAFSGGNTDIRGDTVNAAGARIVTSGAGAVTTFFDDVVHNGLEIFTGAGASTVFFGDQSGAGSFTGTGTVYFIGDLRPGNSPASVIYGGDVAFGGASILGLEIGGLLAGTQFDRLSIAGTLFEDGVLEVSLYGGFMPGFGDTFDLFDAGAVAGSFDDVNLPALAGGLEWDATNLQSTGQLRVVPEPSAPLLAMLGAALLCARRRAGKIMRGKIIADEGRPPALPTDRPCSQ